MKFLKNKWFKTGLWSVVYLLFIIWVGNFWWLLLWPFIFDAFITKFVPWTWWKKSKNKTVLTVMSWVDAIVFALVAVYFINTFLFQNYQIPSSSLEKTLLVGDFLFVSKASYGPRVPMTPLSFPLVQNTLPVLNCNSYLEHPHWKYRRLKGFTHVKRGDIVVFNFPAGDTVTVNRTNPDYYTSCYYEGLNALTTEHPDSHPTADQCMSVGRKIVASKKQEYGDIVYRPVDRRENYVKRCVGLPGDWIQVKNNQLYVNGKIEKNAPGVQFNYFVQTDGTLFSADYLERLHISKADREIVSNQLSTDEIKKLGFNDSLPVYHFPLDKASYNQLIHTGGVVKVKIEKSECALIPIINNSRENIYMDGCQLMELTTQNDIVYPLGANLKWTRDNYGPIWIPKKGLSLKLNMYNLPMYQRVIRVYEHNTLVVRNGKFYINGKETTTYKFKMNYYWMMGDNRHMSADSRYWGFVPEDHIVGRPVLIWLSLDKDKGWFSGKIRFNRFFKDAER